MQGCKGGSHVEQQVQCLCQDNAVELQFPEGFRIGQITDYRGIGVAVVDEEDVAFLHGGSAEA